MSDEYPPLTLAPVEQSYMLTMAGRADGVAKHFYGDGTFGNFRFIATDDDGRVILSGQSVQAIAEAVARIIMDKP